MVISLILVIIGTWLLTWRELASVAFTLYGFALVLLLLDLFAFRVAVWRSNKRKEPPAKAP